MFSIQYKTEIIITATLNMSSANAFNLDQRKDLLFGKELKQQLQADDCLFCNIRLSLFAALWYSEELYSKSNLFFYFNVFTFTAYHISPNKSALPNSNSPLQEKTLKS